MWNVAPSVSASVSIGGWTAAIWKTSIALHIPTRGLLAQMWHHFRKKQISEAVCVQVAHVANLVEVLGLLLLSAFSSQEHYLLHQMGFCLFLVFSLTHMKLSNQILSRMPPSKVEAKSLRAKEVIFQMSCSIILGSLYFYWRHNAYCESGMYSLFAISEYIIILLNMAYHYTSMYEFGRTSLIIA